MNHISTKVLFFCVSIVIVLLLPKSSKAQEPQTIIRVETNKNQTKHNFEKYYSLSSSGNYFLYMPFSFGRDYANPDAVNRVLSKLTYFEALVIDLLDPKTKVSDHSRDPGIPIWGIVYANLPQITKNDNIVDTNSPQYALALIFAKRYDEATKVALNIIGKDKDNYGAMVLLGLLSMRNQEYFVYMEKAFAVNPMKTISLVDWHCSFLEIKVDKNEWDFVDAYMILVMKNAWKFKDDKTIPSTLALRLSETINKKYYSNYQLLPEKEHLKSQLATLTFFLNPIIRSGQKPAGKNQHLQVKKDEIQNKNSKK